MCIRISFDKTFGCDGSDRAAAIDERVTLEHTGGGEVPEDHATALLEAASPGTTPARRELSESDNAMQLSSIDASPVTKIIRWLDKYVVSDLFS